MIIPIELRFKADKDSKSAFRTDKTIKSHDVNSVEFHISIDGLELTADHTVKVLSVFNGTKSQTNVTCDITDGKAIYRPDTSIISQNEHVRNYVYVYHGNQSLDVREFIYSVSLSKIDETALKVKEVYDQSYSDLLADFELALQNYKDSLPQADSVRADIDEILNQFSEDSQAKLNQYDNDAQQAIADNQTAFDLAETGRQDSYEQAEDIRNQASSQAVADWIQEADALLETVEGNESARVDAEASRVEKESERVQAETERIQAEQDRKEAETLREESYEQKVDTAIVEADVVEKVDNKVTELTPQINNLTAQLAQTASNFKSTEEDEQPTISEEELMDGSNWVLGSGWSGNFTNGFTHAKGNTEPLTKKMSDLGNNFYQIEITVESPETTKDSNSGWEISLGGSDGFEMYEGNFTQHTYTRTIRSGGGNDLVITPVSNFDGTIKKVSMKLVVGTTNPTFVIKDSTGENVMEVTSTGADKRNVFIGKGIARYNTTGNRNVAIGDRAFADNSSGFWNVAIGDEAMLNNTVGSRSVAIGHIALRHNTVGHRNIAIGPFTLEQNTTGTNNVAIGVDPMQFGKDAHFNIAIGTSTLTRVENGEDNIALGRGAGSRILRSNNIGIGRSALANNEGGDNSVAIGGYALAAVSGGVNVAYGYRSLWKLNVGTTNTAFGTESLQNLTGGTGNIGIGHGVGNSLTTGSQNVLIGGNVINGSDSNKINIGEHIYGDKVSHKTYLGGRKEPTAILELRQGTGISGGAPLKFNEGNLLSRPEAGTFEFKDGVLYFTGVAGQRKIVSLV